jgi:acyl CoA:acetate/3-ketoacid CoA transferase alpha subunit
MALVREILRSNLRDLTIVSYGGADVGMLCAAGKVKKLVFAFVSLDFIPLEPYFRIARQSGALEVMEIDEGMLMLGLQAAGMRIPFIPTRIGLGTDVLKRNPGIALVDSPYDARQWVARPALALDVALLHADRADVRGVCQVKGPDLYMDALPQQWAAEQPNFRYVPVLSEPRPEDQWSGRTGLVHQAVMSDLPDLSAHEVYACGAPIMVESARADFTGRCGLPEDAFFADAFTSAADLAK